MPWLNKGRREVEFDVDTFKVSDRPCVKLSQWESAAIGDMVPQRAYHIIDRHILVGPGQNVRPGETVKGTPKQIHFGYYDQAFLDYRPPNYPNANKEINTGHPFTKQYMNTKIYKDILRMASAVWSIPPQPGDKPAYLTSDFGADDNNPAGYAPVVFPTAPNQVIWVYSSRPFLGQPLYEKWYKDDPRYPNKLIHNVFPFFQAQKDYEDSIQ